MHLPLEPVKFPQSSRELLKEGRDSLKNRSVPLDGFRMVSVNKFICSRVLIRSYTWPDSVSTCDTFLERGIVRASAGNNLMLTFYR
ncbi:hypothetical protein AMECASPLE_019609 [Ameca splendens]|uniref:Uncharacterized protein n=1 Tax=Ameca splendens TaxID=208324 RepID=A0ABV0YEK9_9TELE